MDKKYILFDLDGTITDPIVGITNSFQYALKKFNIETDVEDLGKYIGPPLTDTFKKFFTDDKIDSAIKEYREYFSKKGLYENTPYEGISELLQLLKSDGKTLIIATSKVTVFAKKILEYFDLIKYFDFVAGSTLQNTRTKKSEVIMFALEQNNIQNLSDVIMIGDREHDIIGAKQCGIDSVGVLYGYGNFEELKNAGANYIVNNIKELSELLY